MMGNFTGGLIGTLDAVPAGHVHETVLVAADSVSAAMEQVSLPVAASSSTSTKQHCVSGLAGFTFCWCLSGETSCSRQLEAARSARCNGLNPGTQDSNTSHIIQTTVPSTAASQPLFMPDGSHARYQHSLRYSPLACYLCLQLGAYYYYKTDNGSCINGAPPCCSPNECPKVFAPVPQDGTGCAPSLQSSLDTGCCCDCCCCSTAIDALVVALALDVGAHPSMRLSFQYLLH